MEKEVIIYCPNCDKYEIGSLNTETNIITCGYCYKEFTEEEALNIVYLEEACEYLNMQEDIIKELKNDIRKRN